MRRAGTPRSSGAFEFLDRAHYIDITRSCALISNVNLVSVRMEVTIKGLGPGEMMELDKHLPTKLSIFNAVILAFDARPAYLGEPICIAFRRASCRIFCRVFCSILQSSFVHRDQPFFLPASYIHSVRIFCPQLSLVGGGSSTSS
jgi:hypothetical protein